MIIAPPPTSNPQIGQATATIKTGDGAYQTVPVILQHGNNQVGNIQIQKQIGGIGQQIIQPVVRIWNFHSIHNSISDKFITTIFSFLF